LRTNSSLATSFIVGGTGVPKKYGGHGLRIGVQEVTRYGTIEENAEEISDCMVDAMAGEEGVKDRATDLARRFNKVRFTMEDSDIPDLSAEGDRG
jgi:hypothetical protein